VTTLEALQLAVNELDRLSEVCSFDDAESIDELLEDISRQTGVNAE